jgi:GNAT superfamily N-acetyltransferase
MLVWMTTYYLETHHPDELRRPARPALGELRELVVERVQQPSGALNRRFYATVGADWTWTDRLPWTDEQWERYARQPRLDTYVARVGREEIGYFELDRQIRGNTEIAYFGLLPAAIGRGLGGQLLSRAIELAWQDGAKRIWVHTCTFDHPRALANYQARGMRLYKQESYWKEG